MKKDKKSSVLKYFEITLSEAHKWSFLDYLLFAIESLYSTILPFISGVKLAQERNLLWLLGLILPIYVRFRHIKQFEDIKRKKKLYVK